MYKYDDGNNWLVDGDGNIVCQFWNKFEYDYYNSRLNGKKVEAALNAMEAGDTAHNISMVGAKPPQIGEAPTSPC